MFYTFANSMETIINITAIIRNLGTSILGNMMSWNRVMPVYLVSNKHHNLKAPFREK